MKATEGRQRGSTSCIEGAVTKSASQLWDSPFGDGQEAAEVWVGKEVPTANAALAISAPIPWLAHVMKQIVFAIISFVGFFCEIEPLRLSKTFGHRSSSCSRDRAAPVVFLRESGGLQSGSAGISRPSACALWATGRSGICVGAIHFRLPKIPERSGLDWRRQLRARYSTSFETSPISSIALDVGYTGCSHFCSSVSTHYTIR